MLRLATSAVSPRPRGSTRIPAVLGGGEVGFPAPAGIDPLELREALLGARFPRARGDRPYAFKAGVAPIQVSPRPRGSTRRRAAVPGAGPGFPAPAGIDPRSRWASHRPQRFPRARGDRPDMTLFASFASMVSPRPRGSTLSVLLRRLAFGGFPAPAGIDRPSSAARYRVSGFPRARGDRPIGLLDGRLAWRVSPRPRGSTSSRRRRPATTPGFPAPAGIDPRARPSLAEAAGFPRARGDRPPSRRSSRRGRRVSPRPRGSTRDHLGRDREGRGFPAPAGIDHLIGQPAALGGWFPRARGDRPLPCTAPRSRSRVSPRPRGSTPDAGERHGPADGFPAPAGIDPRRSWRLSFGLGFPRARGDRPLMLAGGAVDGQVSPRPRGSTLAGHRSLASTSGFPAPAGIDPTASFLRDNAARFPRARGDRPDR